MSDPQIQFRLAAHWAAQSVAAAGNTLATARDDFSHTALTWDAAHGALVGVPVTDDRRAALRLYPFAVGVVGADDVEWSMVPGRTLDQLTRWLGTRFEHDLVRPQHELPCAPVSHGATFE